MPRVKSDPKSWDDLNHNQKGVIKWMVDNDKDHVAVIKEGLSSSNTVYAVWTLPRIEAWKQFYRDHEQRQLTVEERIDGEIESLADNAIEVMRETLVTGKGNAVAVRAAEWVLEAILAARAQRKPAHQAPGTVHDSAERELAAVLRLVK